MKKKYYFFSYFFLFLLVKIKKLHKKSPTLRKIEIFVITHLKVAQKYFYWKECTNGYAITIQNEGYDNQSCKIDQYKMKLKETWYLKYVLKCYDFNREYIYDVY